MKKDKNTMLNTKQKEFINYAVKKFGSNELSTSQLKESKCQFWLQVCATMVNQEL